MPRSNEADALTSLNDVKVSVLGKKKGELTQVLKGMKDVAPEDRPKVGQMVNEARQAIETALEEKSKKINQSLRAEKMKRENDRRYPSGNQENRWTQTSESDRS